MRTARPAAAFSLIEITLALGIAAFTLIAVFGLLPTGLNSNQTASEQLAASNLTTAIVADLRATATGNNASPRYKITPGVNATLYLDSGGASVSKANARYQAAVSFKALGGRSATVGTVWIAWPAAAASSHVLGSVNTFFALDRN